MTKPIARDPIYRGRVFDAEIIGLCRKTLKPYASEEGVTSMRQLTRENPSNKSESNRALKKCLSELLNAELDGSPAEIHTWRARNGNRIELVTALGRRGMVSGDQYYHVTFLGLLEAPGKRAAAMRRKCQRVFNVLRKHHPVHPKEALSLADLARQAGVSAAEALQCARFLSRSPTYLSIQDSDPANIRISPNEQYVTFSGFSEVKSRARQAVNRPSIAWEPIGLGEAVGAPGTLMRLLEVPECESVREGWRTAIGRLGNDHTGAITAGRSVLESACKHVLEESGVSVDAQLDLPKLYKKATQCLQLDHLKEVDESLRRVLQAGVTMVDGLSHLRNRLGDAHGKSRQSPRPSRRHANLVVALSGSLSDFLLATLEAQKPL